MYCVGICQLDADDHFCIGCGRCFNPKCEICDEDRHYKPA